MPHKHKVYSAEFKRAALRLLQSRGKRGAVLAQELGISDGTLYTWRKQLTQPGQAAFPLKGHQTPTEEEFRQRQAENERLSQQSASLPAWVLFE